VNISDYRNVNIGLASGQLLPANETRKGVLIGCATGASFFIAFGRDAVVDVDMLMPANGSPVLLIADVFGNVINGEIRAIAKTVAVTVGVLDIFCPCGNIADPKRRK
jgi:hypothetical protein